MRSWPQSSAALDVPAQRRGATGGQVAQGLALLGRQHAAVAVQERLAVLPDHVRHFQRRPLGPTGRSCAALRWRRRRGVGGRPAAARAGRAGWAVCCS